MGWPDTSRLIRLALGGYAAVLAVATLRVLADGPPVPMSTMPAGPGNWFLLASSIVTCCGAAVHAWITAEGAHAKRRIDETTREAKRLAERLEETSRERDVWMCRAYALGYRGGDDLPVFRDPWESGSFPKQTPDPGPPPADPP